MISTFYYPFILGILQGIPALAAGFTQDEMLATIFAGLMIGFGIGVVIRAGASTGGMDIPPLILNKKFGLPVSVMLYGFDCTILLLQMLFSNREQILYGILLVLIYTVVLISPEYKRINEAIIQKLDRGSTLFHVTTGYLEKEQKMVLTVISNRELAALKEIVADIDPNAFMTVGSVMGVYGKGFDALSKI